MSTRVDQLTIPGRRGCLSSWKLRGALDRAWPRRTILEAEDRNAKTFYRARIPDAATFLAGDEVDLFLECHLRDKCLGACKRVLPRISSSCIHYRTCKHS